MTENEAIEITEEYKGLFPNARNESESLDIAIKAIEWQNAFKKTYKGFPKDVDVACDTAIKALEKQIPKKPVMKPYFEDMEEEYLCCPTCGEILTDRIPSENKDFYFHCMNCG